ncbi:MAG: hypothetical protein ACTHOB_07195 [Ginsengibacter sp.]
MQKLELRNNLNQILKKLKSEEIIKTFQQGAIDKMALLQLFVNSKAGYDQAISERENQVVFDQFEASKLYDTAYFADLLSIISTATVQQSSNSILRQTLLSNNKINDFYSFKTLISTFNLIDNLLITDRQLFDEKDDFNISEAESNGNLILEMIDEENMSLKILTQILKSLEKLIETVYLLFDKIENQQFNLVPKVMMIDSGSDINFILKLPEEATKLIAQIIKEFWDLLINNKTFRHDQKLKTIEKSITVLGKIKQAEENQIIDSVTAEVLKKGIIVNTENIVLKNTLTKQILIEKREFSNRALLLEQSSRYLLSDKEDKDLKNNNEDLENNNNKM